MDTTTDDEDEQQNSNDEILPSIQGNEQKRLSRKLKILTAIAIFYGNITFGCVLNTYGPALTSLQTKYDTDDATISKVFTILTGCYMVGALHAGIIFNYINRQLAVIIILTTMSVVMFVTPLCPTLRTFFLSAAVLGLCVGAYDSAQFVWLMEMMQKECPPYVQTQHFCYAVGTILVSLIMAPFLDDGDDEDNTTTTEAISWQDNSTLFNDNAVYEQVTKKNEADDSKLFVPYLIIGILVAIAAVYQTLLFTFMRYHPPPPEVSEKEELEDESETQGAVAVYTGFKIGSWSLPKLRVVVLCAAFFGAYSAMEMCTFQFFCKFAQNSDMKLSEKDAAYLLTGMTAAFSVGRGIAIIAVFKISTQLILCGNIVFVVVANVLLICLAKSSLPVLWSSSILFGLGFSSMYPSFCAYTERYVNFTNFIGSLMVVCGSGVGAIYPLIVGRFIESNPLVLSYTTFFSIGVILVAFGTLSYLTSKDKTRY